MRILLGILILCCATGAQTLPIKASANGRYVVDQTGTPLLIMADAPQAIIGQLSTVDMETYFHTRQSQGFNAAWVNLMCNDTLTGQCRANASTYDGLTPFTTAGDFATPRETYFARVDSMLSIAAEHGITVFLNPVELIGWIGALRSNGNTKAYNFGAYLGDRYKDQTNLVWFHGNDFQSWATGSDATLVTNVMDGILSADTSHAHTILLNYRESDSLQDAANYASRVGFNAVYSYLPTYGQSATAYGRSGPVPALFAEAHYEDENVNGEMGTPRVLRLQEWWSMLAGCLAGHIYGHTDQWQMSIDWDVTLSTDGTTQFGYWRDFFAARQWYALVPDLDNSVVTAGYGTAAYGGDDNTSDSDYATTARAADGSRIVSYMPTRRTISVDMTKMAGTATAQWFDPSAGTYATISGSPFANSGTQDFTPDGNNAAGDGDWVLLLESVTPAVRTTGGRQAGGSRK